MAKERVLSPYERAIQMAQGEGREVGLPDDPWASEYPNVWEAMTKLYIRTEFIKDPATLTFKAGPGGVVVTLNDRALRMSLECITPHTMEGLKRLEDSLASGRAAWKMSGKGEPQLKKRQHRT